MRRALFIFFLLPLSLNAQAFEELPYEEGCSPFSPDTSTHNCELVTNAEFPGGIEGLHTFLSKNLKYPKKDKCVSEKILATFTIDTFGNVTNIQVVKGNCVAYVTEVKRVLSLMPRWAPGKCSGRYIKMIYQLPINFNKD
jgi:hypothetical protein